MLNGKALHLIVIDQPRIRVQAILDGVVDLAGEVDAGTMGQVPTMGQAHAQNRVARLEQRHEYGRVGL